MADTAHPLDAERECARIVLAALANYCAGQTFTVEFDGNRHVIAASCMGYRHVISVEVQGKSQ